MSPDSVGELICRFRTRKGWTQVELAEKLHLSEKTISKWETGGGYPDIQTLPALAALFETTVDCLLGCNRKEQKVFCFNVNEGTGGRTAFVPKYHSVLNEDYLKNGWNVVQSSVSSEQEMTYMLVVIEKDTFLT